MSDGRSRNTAAPITQPHTAPASGAHGFGGTGGGFGSGGLAAPPSKPHSDEAVRVVREARRRVGQGFRLGEEAQCANFVRDVFEKAQVPIGSSHNPSDRRLLPDPNDLGPGYADSFAGDDVGAKVSRSEIRPGDLVLYQNTYGNYRSGVLTHVAIYVGQGSIVHRPTKSRPVAMDSLDLFPRIGEIRRPHSYKAKVVHAGSAKCFVHDMESAAFINGGRVSVADIRIHVHGGHVEATINGHKVDPVSLSLQLFY